MKYLAFFLILIALSTSMFSQTKTVVEIGYTHYEITADPKNGQSCLAGTAFCVGGGTTSTLIPGDGCIPDKTVITKTPGVYTNFIKEIDNDLSTLTSVVFTVRRKSDNVVLYTETLNRGAGWPVIPTDFLADLKVTPFTADVIGQYYHNGNGILFISSPSIPGSAASNGETLIVSIDPSCSPTATPSGSTFSSTGGVDETFSQEYSPTAIAAMSKSGKLIPGDVKYSELTTDHNGWYLMNGRNISSILNVSAKEVASSIFGSTLPNMDNKYFIADYSTGTRMTNIGQNSFTVANANIQAATLTTTSNGNHSHDLYTVNDDHNNSGGAGYPDLSKFSAAGYDSGNTKTWWGATENTGAHSHNVTIGTASPNSIDNRPVSKKMYAFVYLGE